VLLAQIALVAACGIDALGTKTDLDPNGSLADGASSGGAVDGETPDGGDGAPSNDASNDTTSPPPCPQATVCDVIVSSTVLDVAVTSTALFWLDSSGAVMTSAPSGADAHAIVTGEASPLAGIEADAQFVYWTAGGSLRRAAASDGANATTIATVGGGCLKWMVPGTLLAADPNAGDIWAVNASTGAKTTVTTASTTPWGVAAVAFNDFFYSNYTAGRIRRSDAGLTDPNPIIVQGQSGPRCIVTDKTSLWWANRDSGNLVTAPTSGANPQTIVSGQTMISGLALDASFLYWTWQGGIRKKTK
jgi:hypothetical protein